MRLGRLFHWSPTDRRDEILRDGLRLFSVPTVCTGDHRYPSISLSPSPSQGWGLSGDMPQVSEIEWWDLWEVALPERAETHVRPFWGDEIDELKVYTSIPADRLWLVGWRGPAVAKVAV